MNPNYVQQALAKTEEQAAREGREFVVSHGNPTLVNPGPATTPLGE